MRGPHDEEIKGPEPGDDHARKRLEEFLKERFPGGVPPTSDAGKKDSEAEPPEQKKGGK